MTTEENASEQQLQAHPGLLIFGLSLGQGSRTFIIIIVIIIFIIIIIII